MQSHYFTATPHRYVRPNLNTHAHTHLRIHSTNFNYHLTFEWTTHSTVYNCLYTQRSLMVTKSTSKSCSNSTKKFIEHIRKHATWKLTDNGFLSFISIGKTYLHNSDTEIKPVSHILKLAQSS
jgi:hypothetical protein